MYVPVIFLLFSFIWQYQNILKLYLVFTDTYIFRVNDKKITLTKIQGAKQKNTKTA